jgi:hypothetical protein
LHAECDHETQSTRGEDAAGETAVETAVGSSVIFAEELYFIDQRHVAHFVAVQDIVTMRGQEQLTPSSTIEERHAYKWSTAPKVVSLMLFMYAQRDIS